MNIILLIGSLLGLSSLLMGTYIDHSLSLYLAEKSLKSVLTAARYHQLYALFISLLGLVSFLQLNVKIKYRINQSAYLFIVGILFFSFGIYASVILNIQKISYLIPLGGIILMLGWVCLIQTAFIKNKY